MVTGQTLAVAIIVKRRKRTLIRISTLVSRAEGCGGWRIGSDPLVLLQARGRRGCPIESILRLVIRLVPWIVSGDNGTAPYSKTRVQPDRTGVLPVYIQVAALPFPEFRNTRRNDDVVPFPLKTSIHLAHVGLARGTSNQVVALQVLMILMETHLCHPLQVRWRRQRIPSL